MSSSLVSLPSPRPFHWDSPEVTIRLVTSSTTPGSDSQYALDYFESAGRRFSYRLGPSAFESLDSIAVRSAENHTDDERGSVYDYSLTSEGSLIRSDTVSSVVDTRLFVEQGHNILRVANKRANGIGSRDPKHEIRASAELVKSQEEQKRKTGKGLFNRARSLLKLFTWRKQSTASATTHPR